MGEQTAGELLARWQAGDQQAATALFHRYADRLIALARSRVSGHLTHRVDPEDVVQSAYRSFFADARKGRYASSAGGELWQLLVSITLHKLHKQINRLRTQKRSVAREQHLPDAGALHGLHAAVLAQEPSPVEAVALTDEVEQLMRRLDSVERQILQLRLQGHNLGEIADQVNCSERTIRRALDEIKQQLRKRHTSVRPH